MPISSATFPDLKGQAPLRRVATPGVEGGMDVLFLTSKVRLHCDWGGHASIVMFTTDFS